MGSSERLVRLPHARPEALAPYSGLLDQLRSLPALTEQRSAGTFHRGSRTFLHFHAHPDGLVADLKAGGWMGAHRGHPRRRSGARPTSPLGDRLTTHARRSVCGAPQRSSEERKVRSGDCYGLDHVPTEDEVIAIAAWSRHGNRHQLLSAAHHRRLRRSPPTATRERAHRHRRISGPPGQQTSTKGEGSAKAPRAPV